MHITLESDYAVRIVDYLAGCGGRRDAKTISENCGVTLRFSLKILRKLVARGIVRSFKGTKGGYELARLPSEISLKDVIETVEGPLIICRCLSDDFNCGHVEDGGCKFQRVYDDISTALQESLAAVKFSDM